MGSARRFTLHGSLLFVAFLSSASSCGPDARAQRTMHVIRTLRAHASGELGCPPSDLRLQTDSRRRAGGGEPIYTVVGCERTGEYVCFDRCPRGCRLDVDCESACQVECRPAE